MHDRRLDGQVKTFGNQGALYMNAMTWWDHETESVWAQPWGAAIQGDLTGKALTLLPSNVVRWATWLSENPDTKVLIDERGEHFGRQIPTDRFVIGVSVQEDAVGLYFPSAQAAGVVNHQVGKFPIVVSVNPDNGAIDVYLRTVVGTPRDGSVSVPDVLSFELDEAGRLVDAETGSAWDFSRGVAVEGPMRGAALQQLPYTTAFDWAWEDFFPSTQFWGEKPIIPLPKFFG